MVMFGKYGYGRASLAAVPYVLSASGSATARKVSRSNSQAMITTKKRKRGGNVSLKTLIKRTESAKHYTLESNIAVLHNTLYTCVPTQGIVQGSTNAAGRTGDEVYLCALKIHGVAVSASAAGAYSYRIIVGWSGEEVTTSGAGTGLVSGLALAELFLPTTGANYSTNGLINPKAFTCLYDETIDINSLVVSTNDVRSFALTVPINQSFCYQSSGSIQGKTRNLCVLVVATVYGGTTGTTSAGAAILSADLIYKD